MSGTLAPWNESGRERDWGRTVLTRKLLISIRSLGRPILRLHPRTHAVAQRILSEGIDLATIDGCRGVADVARAFRILAGFVLAKRPGRAHPPAS